MAVPDVTSDDVRQIWQSLIDGQATTASAAVATQRLLDRANAEDPVVGDGLLYLAGLARMRPLPTANGVRLSYLEWERTRADWDKDSDASFREYFRSILLRYGRAHGYGAAEKFGGKLVRINKLSRSDLASALDELSGNVGP